jgi:hypothetical protein
MESVTQDVRFGLRLLGRNRGFTIVFWIASARFQALLTPPRCSSSRLEDVAAARTSNGPTPGT